MKRIMVVDDEILVRVGIKSIINWEEHGWSMVAEASNGLEAIEKIKQYEPHIVLTDLMMDKMDGFELIKQCKQDYPKVKFIVLSSYNDFENVKKAMKLGAEDYVFKLTAKSEDILKIMEEASSNIEEEVSDSTKSIVLKNLSVIKARILRAGIQRNYYHEEEIQKELNALALVTDMLKPYRMIYISIDDYCAVSYRGNISEIQLMKFSMENIIQETIQKNFQADVFNYDNGDLIIILNETTISNDVSLELLHSMRTIYAHVKRYLGVLVSCAISGVYQGVGNLKLAEKEVTRSLQKRFFADESLFVPIDTTNKSYKREFLSHESVTITAIKESIAYNHFEGIHKFLEDYFGKLYKMNDIAVENVRVALLEIYHCFRNKGLQYRVVIDELKDVHHQNLYEAIIKYDKLKSIEGSFYQFIAQYKDKILETKVKPCRKEILTIKSYVDENLTLSLSVQDAARYINMSESYFSHLFKREMNLSYIDYVNKMRVEKATELLCTTDMKIHEVASAVGIENANYFSVLFKKLTGKTPIESRNQSMDSGYPIT